MIENRCWASRLRTGLPFRLAHEACGVLHAAARKHLTDDHLWHYPPPDAFAKLAVSAPLIFNVLQPSDGVYSRVAAPTGIEPVFPD